MSLESRIANIRAKKSLWQNFLIDEEILFQITSATHVHEKNIIEVGPWYGALTDFLIEQKPNTLTLVELDPDMIEILQERHKAHWSDFWWNINIIHQDILKFSPPQTPYSVIANIPYYITSPILFHFLYPFLEKNTFSSPEEMVILMQKEVGEKILENIKKPKFSYLSLTMHQACDVIEPICVVPNSAFDPVPKVDSIVLKFSIKKERDFILEKQLLELWNKCFSHPRKTLIYNLKSAGKFSEIILETLNTLWYSNNVRAEAIKKEDWKKILIATHSEK